MSSTLRLTKGQVTILDDEDYAVYSRWRWKALERVGCYYAIRTPQSGGIYLHRAITACPSGLCVDHIDGDTLNNQRSNLRIATSRQNSQNMKKRAGSSVFKGVHIQPRDNLWVARIRVNGRALWLGSHHEEVDAARAYDKAAREHFGEFARLNFPHEQ